MAKIILEIEVPDQFEADFKHTITDPIMYNRSRYLVMDSIQVIQNGDVSQGWFREEYGADSEYYRRHHEGQLAPYSIRIVEVQDA